eukprot:6848693-Prorocentrum_lima.AAC.1
MSGSTFHNAEIDAFNVSLSLFSASQYHCARGTMVIDVTMSRSLFHNTTIHVINTSIALSSTCQHLCFHHVNVLARTDAG